MHVKFIRKGEKKNRIDLTSDQKFTLTQANHIHVEGDVTINGVAARYGTHLYRKFDGSWVPPSQMEPKQYQCYDVHIVRIDSNEDLSSGTRNKAIQELPGMLSKILNGMDASELNALRKQAEQKCLGNLIASKSSDLDEKRKEIDALQEEIDELSEQLKKIHDGEIADEYRLRTK